MHAVNFTACVFIILFIRRVLTLLFGFQAAQAGFELGDALVDNIRQILLVQIVRRAALDIADADDLRGYTDGSALAGRFSAQRCQRRRGRVTDVDRAQHLRARADQHIVAQRRMALAGVLAGTAQGDAVVDCAVVADLRRLTKDDAHTVVDKELVPDLAPGWISMPVEVARQLADKTGQEETPVVVQKMCDLVRDQHMKAGVQDDDLRHIARGGVLIADIFASSQRP